MAVLDQSYRRWDGRATNYARRVLVIPRYDVLEILQKRTWLLAWIVCLVPPIVLGLSVYVATNIQSLRALVPLIPPQFQLPPPGPDMYRGFLTVQCWLLVAFAILVGPPLATRDFANGAIPLYLSKSLRRWDYVAGRCAVIASLLSLASWVPYLFILVMECGMAPASWRRANAGLFFDVIVGTLPTVLLLTTLIVAVGAVVQRTNLARAALLFLLLGVKPLMFPLSSALEMPSLRVLSPTDVTGELRDNALMRSRGEEEARQETAGGEGMGSAVAAFGLAAWLGACLTIITRRVRPVEVVK